MISEWVKGWFYFTLLCPDEQTEERIMTKEEKQQTQQAFPSEHCLHILSNSQRLPVPFPSIPLYCNVGNLPERPTLTNRIKQGGKEWIDLSKSY